MDKETVFEIYVTGEAFELQSIPAKEITDFILSVDKVFTSVAKHRYPNIDTGDKPFFGIHSIKAGSMQQTWVPHVDYKEVGQQVFGITTQAIETSNYSGLPAEAIVALRGMRKFNKSTNTRTEFASVNESRQVLATITPDTRIVKEHYLVPQTSTLYGTVLRVGGVNPPRALMQFLDGTQMSCPVASTALARQIAERLYEVVGVSGSAKWDIGGMGLKEFTIRQLLDYRETKAGDAIDMLAETLSPHYRDIEDLEKWFADLRAGDEMA